MSYFYVAKGAHKSHIIRPHSDNPFCWGDSPWKELEVTHVKAVDLKSDSTLCRLCLHNLSVAMRHEGVAAAPRHVFVTIVKELEKKIGEG